MIDPVTLAESRRLLNQARLIAEAPAAQSSEIGHGHPDSSPPPGAFTYTTSTLQVFGERINDAIAYGSDAGLRTANASCAAELQALTHSSAVGAETPLEFRARILRDYEGQLAGVVARAEMTSVTTVRKIRSEGGRDARTGREV